MRTAFRTQKVLGKELIDHQQQIVLAIGSDTWSRQEMIDKMRCGNFVAASKLSKAMKHLSVKSVKDALGTVVVSELMSIRGIGVTSVYVFMCAIASMEKNPLEWVDFERNPVTVGTRIVNARQKKGKKKNGRSASN